MIECPQDCEREPSLGVRTHAPRPLELRPLVCAECRWCRERVCRVDGRKTQTRLPIKPQPPNGMRPRCPLGEPGDRLWVRETWADVNTEGGPAIAYRAGGMHFCSDDAYPVEYERYPGCQFDMWITDLLRGEPWHKWRPSIHMPRWASRLLLEITEVRAERLQDISEDDALAEGLIREEDMPGEPFPYRYGLPGRLTNRTHYAAYARVWDGIYAAKGLGWDASPWVWVRSFRVL